MAQRVVDIHDEVQRRVIAQGEEGAAWVAGLGLLVDRLERDWRLTVGRTLRGGSGSIVLEASTADGQLSVLKIPIPWLDPDHGELRALLAGNGRGYARVIRHEEATGAILLERLGPAFHEIGLDIDAQIAAICATLLEAWRPLPAGLPFMTGAEKAIDLAAFIERQWREQGKPCSERTIETALAFTEIRRKAFDPETAVLAHGDPHAGNLLVADGGDGRRFKFVDPDGLFIERAYDLGIPMREWSVELAAGDALRLGQSRCRLLARLSGVEAEPIWQWGFIERVATGLLLKQLGWDAWSREGLSVADAWASGPDGS